MKRVLLFLFLLLFELIISAQEGNSDVSDGYHAYKYPNGVVSSEGIIKNGRPDGFWKSYYVTGIKKSEGKRSNFLLDIILL